MPRAKQNSVPPTRRRPGAPVLERIRWSIHRASLEFDEHHERLRRRVLALGIMPGDDGFYSSADLKKILFGDKEAEEIGLTAARRREVEARNRQIDGELVPVERVALLGERFVAAVRRIVLNSGLSEIEKNEALSEIVQLKDVDWTREAKEASR